MKRPFTLLAAEALLAASCRALAATHDVDRSSSNPTTPYPNWTTAATIIQDAVDAAAARDEIVVTIGVYATGAWPVGTNVLANRVAMERTLRLRSVHGPQFTTIQGYQVPGTTNEDGAIRCGYLAEDAILYWFTLTNGGAGAENPLDTESRGDGIWCESTNALVSNGVISANSAGDCGAGASKPNNSTVTANSASAGGGVAGTRT